MHRDSGWQIGAWAGFVCALVAATGLAQDSTEQALIFFVAAVFLFLWAAWLARARH
jgi:ABC-type arginine transport system permease subunit